MDRKNMLEEIKKLRKKRGAVILAHNYQLGEIQDAANFSGDSLELSFRARDVRADVIVFCGVKFMAETAYLLSPQSKVLLPVREAGCKMADMADADSLRKMKSENPGALVVCYVNSTAEVKAESDICVTSSNALKIVSSLPADRKIIFVPDRNLGAYIRKKTGRDMILWPGYCPSHNRINPEDVIRRKREFPEALVIMHPEARLESLELADEILSTGGMCEFSLKTDAKQIIVATESGIIHRLKKENPEKTFIPVSEQTVCPDMKLIRLEELLESLQKDQFQVTVPAELVENARRPIEKMLNGGI